MTTIGLVANVYNEVNALPGWLETHLPYFDDVRVLHAGPNGEWSTDGTIELLTRWRIPITFTEIDKGFGAVRNQAIEMSPCDWVMILDADERFFPVVQTMHCDGHGTPHSEVDEVLRTYDFRNGQVPDWTNLRRLGQNLIVTHTEPNCQGAFLREVLRNDSFDVVATIRRHWHDFSFNYPTQNWYNEPDWQMRLIRKSSGVRYDTSTRMHERLQANGRVYRGDGLYGPFFDHFHFPFKRMEVEQRAHDVAIYDAIHEGKEPPKWQTFKK